MLCQMCHARGAMPEVLCQMCRARGAAHPHHRAVVPVLPWAAEPSPEALQAAVPASAWAPGFP